MQLVAFNPFLTSNWPNPMVYLINVFLLAVYWLSNKIQGSPHGHGIGHTFPTFA
jgi:hypothetical protein